MANSRDPSQTILDDIARKMRALESRVNDLENQQIVTLQTVDPGDFPPNAIEGQIAKGTDGSIYVYDSATDAWVAIGGGGSAGTELERLHQTYTWVSPSVTYSGWAHSGGDTLTDISVSQRFKPLTAGQYAVMIWCNDNTSTGDTTNKSILFQLNAVKFFPYNGLGPTSRVNMIGVGGVGSGYHMPVSASIVSPMEPTAGDYFEANVNSTIGTPPNTSGDIYAFITKIL